MPRPPASSLPALLIVDAANVVGSVPDGWWRDRHGATERLRDALAPLAERGLADAHTGLAAPLEVLLIVEGAARRVSGTHAVRVEVAPRSGDDMIVAAAAAEEPRRPLVAVVTADRALRTRVRAVGAVVLGPQVLAAFR